MLRLEVIGHIGKDAEVKKIGDRDYYVFSVAYTRKTKENSYTTWVECRKIVGESTKLGEYLKKGQQILVSGEPSANAYMKGNEPTASLNLFVNNLKLLGGARQQSNGTDTQEGDDLPF